MLMYGLKRVRCGFAIEKKLFVYDSGQYDNTVDSGIRATIFGATGFIGNSVASTLGRMGSQLIMPIDKANRRHYQIPKQLKLNSTTHKSWVQWETDMNDGKLIEDMAKKSNVVINLLGPRKNIKKRQDFEFINIQVPQRIAKACAKHGVMRMIHFSSAAADPNSSSLDFQTKYQGQLAVKAAFPNVTILRPCLMFGINDYFSTIIQRQSTFFFHRCVFVYDDCTTLKQPIREHDVSKCVLNALKLEQTKGKTYELGGPHVLSTLEMHEILLNILNVNPKIAYVNPELAMKVASKIYNWQFFGQQVIRKRTIPQVVTGKHGTISDLFVEPVSYKNGIFDALREFIFTEDLKDEDTEN